MIKKNVAIVYKMNSENKYDAIHLVYGKKEKIKKLMKKVAMTNYYITGQKIRVRKDGEPHNNDLYLTLKKHYLYAKKLKIEPDRFVRLLSQHDWY